MKKIGFIFLVAMVGLIGVLHYVTPGHMILFHDTYRRLSYFPIAIGAIFYGLWGGLLMAVLSCISFVPHLFMFWFQGREAYYSELSEIVFYLSAGIVIGLISSRENRLKKKYQQLSEKLAASYHRLHNQAARLVQAEKQLGQAQKLSSLGHVSAALAHEIKNPLASIKGAAEILADEVPVTHPKHEFIVIMRSEISRLNNSVNEVLAYCRGQQTINKDRLQAFPAILDKVILLLAPRIREKSIDLILEKTGDAEEILFEEAAMIQVLMNILLNAVDAVPHKGKICIYHSREPEGYTIDVADNGPGVAPEKDEQIFEPFITFKENGTGLGLSITKKIIERLGGTIRVTPSNMGGAQFSVFLPDKTALST
ncbi:MAG: HAMP domain-containing histidine kinase [Proteobacteria bacterium]|nr:HAMP domain-containing histidine kinase [Pseudomonadota bacterium]